MRVSWMRAALATAGGCAALAATSPASAVAAPVSSAGCAPARPAVAYRAGGAVISPAPERLVPCATATGFYTGETGIGVTKQGTVWFSAANWEWELARTDDDGAHWQAVSVPGPQADPGCLAATSAVPGQCSTTESSKTNTVADAYLYVDPYTSKIFWTKTYGLAVCGSLSMSADDGATWDDVPSANCPGGDYEKTAAGPPPAGGAAPTGYPDVVYTCVNGPAPVFVVGPARTCDKSLDGGDTFSVTGLPPVPSPQAPGCLLFQEPMRVGPDGTIYQPLNCAVEGQNSVAPVMVALSKDEGQTWSYVTVPNAGVGSNAGTVGGVSLDVDRSGTVYVVWPGANDKVYLSVSKDQGATWNGPLQVTAPGVTQAQAPWAQVTAQGPGHIAIAYYGYTGTDTTHLNGYLTESFDGADRNPTFYAGELNDPSQPLYFPVNSGSLPRNDYLGAAFGPDGTPWTGLVKLLSPNPDSQGYIPSSGYAGRLVPASELYETAPSKLRSLRARRAHRARRARGAHRSERAR